LRYLYFNTPP